METSFKEYYLLKFVIFDSLMFRSSHRRSSVRKGVLRNFAKFTGKHLCQSLILNKAAGLFQDSDSGAGVFL